MVAQDWMESKLARDIEYKEEREAFQVMKTNLFLCHYGDYLGETLKEIEKKVEKANTRTYFLDTNGTRYGICFSWRKRQ